MNTRVLTKPLTKPSNHKDPYTGDTLSRGEYISWLIQGVIRRWTFLGLITIITAIAWITANSIVLTWWNLSASYLALVIESVVGIAMFSQTRRDAIALRETRAVSRHSEEILQRLDEHNRAMLKIMTTVQRQEELIVQLLEQGKANIEGTDEDAFYDITTKILNELSTPKPQTLRGKQPYFPERDGEGGHEDFDHKEPS